MEITIDRLKQMLPNPDVEHPTDDYYLTLANYVDKMWAETKLMPEIDENIRHGVVLDLIGYFQDVVGDVGLWRSFVTMCRHLYDKPIPFYNVGETYSDFELNKEDVQFVIWYSLETRLGFSGLVSPFDNHLLQLADRIYKLFDFLYEEAPAADDFKSLRELELTDSEQVKDIFMALGWLFWKSYFLRPFSKYAYEPDIDEEEELSLEETLTNQGRLHTTIKRPTGPLALLADEWLRLILTGELPKEMRRTAHQEHDYYTRLVKAVGCQIAFFPTYDDLERFLTDKMGWDDDSEGLFPQLCDASDFVVYAERHKGLIIAKDVAKFVSHPSNPCYDREAASVAAHRLLMERGVCPIDLLKYLFDNQMVPDAAYPAAHSVEMLHGDWDFIARMYLGDYYRCD